MDAHGGMTSMSGMNASETVMDPNHTIFHSMAMMIECDGSINCASGRRLGCKAYVIGLLRLSDTHHCAHIDSQMTGREVGR